MLKRQDFREVDQIVSLYTRERGKVDALARGVKKIVSKNAAHLEPCSYTWAEIIPGKEMSHLTTVQPLRSFPVIRTDLEKSVMAAVAASFLDRMIDVGEPEPRLFDLLKSWLFFLEKESHVQGMLLDGFVMNVFALLGFLPILDRCVVCEKSFREMMKEDIEQAEKPGLYFAGGGLLCAACVRVKKDIGEFILPVGLKEVSDLALLLDGDWHAVNTFRLEKGEGERLHRLVYEFVVFHSEKRIPDWGDSVLESILAEDKKRG